MKSRSRIDSFTDEVVATATPLGVYGVAASLALALSGVMLVVGALFAIGGDASELLVLGVGGVCCLAVGIVTLRRPFPPQGLRPVATMSASICAYLVVAAISTLVYLLTGTLDQIDDALYESIAGVSTSALSVLDDPSVLGDGVLVWRSATQWLGGFGALSLAIGLLPFLGGSRELSGSPRLGAQTALATRPMPTIKRVGKIYSVVTIAVVLAFSLAGMGLRDAVAHAFSTVSTGGFSTHRDSIGHFDSRAIEGVALVVMAGAGTSVAVAWMLWRRRFDDARRAFELRVYLLVMGCATLWIWWLLRSSPDPDGSTSLREALFSVVSAMSTTGHRVTDWGAWPPGAATMLLVLLVVGGTAGSVAGGLRWIRVLGMGQFVWRELQRQLHPRSIRSVKVGRTKISEDTVDRMHAQMVFVMLLGAVASLMLAVFGEGITEAITLTVSAISTMGPGFDDSRGIVTAAELTRPERGVLMPVMLTGRVFLYPAFVASAAGATAIARSMRNVRVSR